MKRSREQSEIGPLDNNAALQQTAKKSTKSETKTKSFVVTGKLHITDPCYELPLDFAKRKNCSYAVWNVPALKGTWIISCVPYNQKGNKMIVAYHESVRLDYGKYVQKTNVQQSAISNEKNNDTIENYIESRLTIWMEKKIVSESGRIGVWNASTYPSDLGSYNDKTGFFRRVCDSIPDEFQETSDKESEICQSEIITIENTGGATRACTLPLVESECNQSSSISSTGPLSSSDYGIFDVGFMVHSSGKQISALVIWLNTENLGDNLLNYLSLDDDSLSDDSAQPVADSLSNDSLSNDSQSDDEIN